MDGGNNPLTPPVALEVPLFSADRKCVVPVSLRIAACLSVLVRFTQPFCSGHRTYRNVLLESSISYIYSLLVSVQRLLLHYVRSRLKFDQETPTYWPGIPGQLNGTAFTGRVSLQAGAGHSVLALAKDAYCYIWV